MAEGLSLEDAQQAEDNFYNSKYFTEQYEQLKEERATAAKHKDAIIDLLRDKENLMLSDTVVAELEEVRGRMAGLMGIGDPHTISRKEDAAGNSLWKGHQHKEAHLDEYIETARQEAAADGVEIDLGEAPKPETEPTPE
jgi:hypothetical protein